jgi:hypothetical protein
MPGKYHIHWVVLAAWFAVAGGVFLPVSESRAQMSEAEHLSHHPDQAAAAGAGSAAPGPGTAGKELPAEKGPRGETGSPPAGVGDAPPAGAGGGMGGMMDGMMEKMGAPKPKDMYPSLMALTELTPEKRLEVSQQSSERMQAGAKLLGQALDSFDAGTQSDDYAAMHEALTQMREGIAQLESGVAAKRALAEGRAPREVALAWFKQEMSLVTPVVGAASPSGLGLSPLHLFTMVLLVVFALAMVAMYFFKMRRAAALFGRIEASKGAPPPGSAPELAGAAPPPATGADKPAADAKGSSE